MSLLPARGYSNQAASNTLLYVKQGKKQALSDFIWQNQERFYAIAYLVTEDHELATQLTTTAFSQAFKAIGQLNSKQLGGAAWDWLSQFIVDACTQLYSDLDVPKAHPSTSEDDELDAENMIILGPQRVKRCLSTLPPPEKKVFILRYQLCLACDQIAAVLNQHPDDVLALLSSSRVQLIKNLGLN